MLLFLVNTLPWRNLVVFPSLIDQPMKQTIFLWPADAVPTPPGPEKAESQHPQLPRRPTRPRAIQRQREGSACWLSSSLRPGQRAAESAGFLGLEIESATSQCGYWPGRPGLWSLWGRLCPFFGLVIHPNGLEIMTNHNNNSQLNKTSINRNNNWGWEEKRPWGILFRRDFDFPGREDGKSANVTLRFLRKRQTTFS